MNDRIALAFEKAKQQGRIALAPFLTIGHPTLEASIDAAQAVAGAGADVVELGVPFSDPLAEGPTIQRSSFIALQQGVAPETCIEAAAQLRARGVETPLVLMGYYNPILALGLPEFCSRAARAGVAGLIVADLPYEESGPLRDEASRAGLSLIPLLALTSTPERIAAACRGAGGFVYCVSVLGVTGARATMSRRVRRLVAEVRKHTALPVAVGFGVSTPEHVAELAAFADGAVVGSALVNVIGDGPVEAAAERAGAFVRRLAARTARP